MLKQYHIQLTDRIKKPIAGNSIANGLLRIGTIVIYPIVIIIALPLLILGSVFSIFQKLLLKNDKTVDVVLGQEVNSQWGILTEQNTLKIFQKYKGEVRFGPAYLSLKSEPTIEFLNDKTFGDWFFYHDKGIFLQQWNSIEKPNTSLVFIDSITFKFRVLAENIPSVTWDIVDTDTNNLQLTCDTGKEILTYNIVPFGT